MSLDPPRIRLDEKEEELAMREAQLLEMEADIERREMIARSWRPFHHQEPFDSVELQHLSSMTGTFKSAIKKLARNLQGGLSGQSLKHTGANHYRYMWMAHGVQILCDLIERQGTDARTKNEKEQKKDLKEFVENQEKFIERSMMSIYDPDDSTLTP